MKARDMIDLLDMEDDEFVQLVADDIKSTLDPPIAKALRHDDAIDRWLEALTILRSQIDQQMSARKGLTDTESRMWRGNVKRFTGGLTARKMECKALIAERNRAENKAHWTVPSPQSAPDTKEARRRAGDIALHRLCDENANRFKQLLAEEYIKAGLPVKEHWLTVAEIRDTACGAKP